MYCFSSSQDDTGIPGPSILLCSPFILLLVSLPRTTFLCSTSAALPKSIPNILLEIKGEQSYFWWDRSKRNIWFSLKNKRLNQSWNVSAAIAFKTSSPLYYEGQYSILSHSPPLPCYTLVVLRTPADSWSLSHFSLCAIGTTEHLLCGLQVLTRYIRVMNKNTQPC